MGNPTLCLILLSLLMSINFTNSGLLQSTLNDRLNEHLAKLMTTVTKNAAKAAVLVEFKKIAIKKAELNLPFMEKSSSMIPGKSVCLYFLKKRKEYIRELEDSIDQVSRFMFSAVKLKVEARLCKESTFIQSLKCFMALSNGLKMEVANRYNSLLSLEKKVATIEKDTFSFYGNCFKYINMLPNPATVVPAELKNITDADTTEEPPCRLTVAVIDNETGQVVAAPCYKNITSEDYAPKDLNDEQDDGELYY